MANLISLIRSNNFEQEVIMENRPLLLLCMLRSEGFTEQLEVVEAIARKYSGKLKVAYLHEQYIETFSRNYNVIGTPTFLILLQGKEKDRLLGVADDKMLSDLISHTIEGLTE
jgi:thioredoxin-like negative regulator of GroEL